MSDGRIGKVIETNIDHFLVNVKVDNFETGFIPVMMLGAGQQIKTAYMPSEGDEVIVLRINDAGDYICLGSWHRPYKDEERNEHLPDLEGFNNKYIEVGEEGDGTIIINGNLKITGDVEVVKGHVTMTKGDLDIKSGKATVESHITSTDGNVIAAKQDVKADTISLKNHTHLNNGSGLPK